MDRLSQLPGLFGNKRSSEYHRTASDISDNESLLNEYKSTDAACGEGARFTDEQSSIRARIPWLRYVLFALLFALYSFLLVTYAPRKMSDIECGKQVSVFSPIHEAIEFVEYDFNTAFDSESKYRGVPNAELERAWDELYKFEPVPFPEDKLTLVNRTGGKKGDEELARLGDAAGSTSDDRGPVAANFEVFHQLHCLNYLRQYSWREWYFNHPDKVVIPADMLASDVGVRIHADHCIELLRTALMCHGDTSPFFTVIDPSQPLGARGDFNAHHKCKNFEKLQSWNKENGVFFGSFHDQAEGH